MVTLTIDGRQISVPGDTTILEAARAAGIRIPTLCYHERLSPIGSCRMCVVDIEGITHPMAACTTPVREGIRVTTASDRLFRIRRDSLQLILVNHPLECPICDKAGECLLQDLVYEFGIQQLPYRTDPRKAEAQFATPLIRYWPDRCIMCLRCLHACREIKAIGAIDIRGSGYDARIAVADAGACRSCGECLMVCPTGALTENVSRYKARPWLVDRVPTTCTYCGCGCQLELNVLGNRVTGVTTRGDAGVNQGSLCVKGRFGYEFISSPERIARPLVREAGELRESDWDHAIRLVARRLGAIRQQAGPDAVAGLASPCSTNEENYLFQKFFRAAIGTNNIDISSRLCDVPTVAGLAESFGCPAATNPACDLLQSRVILVAGSDTAGNHPIYSNYIVESVLKHGARLIVVDPRRISLVEFADLWLQPLPGTDVAWINSLMQIIISENLHRQGYMDERTEGFENLRSCVARYTPEHASRISGIPAEDLRTAARLYAEAQPASIVYARGLTRHAGGGVRALANLAMLCGNIGIEGGGLNALRGRSNVQGACDMGALPHYLPGYQPVSDPAGRERFCRAWGVNQLPQHPGLTLPGMISAAARGHLKALYIMGGNPLLSEPDLGHCSRSLGELDFLVVQDIFLTETARKADVVLPDLCFAEKDGTFTSSERMVQRVRKAVSPPGRARDALRVLETLSAELGYPMPYAGAEQVMDEIRSVVPDYCGITYRRIADRGIPWPCPSQSHPGTPMLHAGGFARGRGLFLAADYQPPAGQPDRTYPYTLISGRAPQHFLTGAVTRRGNALARVCPEPLAEINRSDAGQLGMADGDFAVIRSPRGSIRIKICTSTGIRRGVIAVPCHFYEAAVNLLTGRDAGPADGSPCGTVCPVSIAKDPGGGA